MSGISASRPDLAHAGSMTSRSWDGSAGAVCAGAIVAIILLVAVAGGVVPAAAGLAIVTLVPAALVDVHERRLPDVWVASAAAVFVVATMAGWIVGDTPPTGDAVLGALVVAGPILALHLLSPASMGFGDVKASIVIGLAVGSVDWQLALVALTLAAGTAGVVGIVARVRTIPFGPFLVLGAWIALLGADRWLAPALESQVAR